MRTGRVLVRRLWKRSLTQEEREIAEQLRRERETARLQNRQAALQAESRHHSRSGSAGGVGPG
jgi:hypothetical protein